MSPKQHRRQIAQIAAHLLDWTMRQPLLKLRCEAVPGLLVAYCYTRYQIGTAPAACMPRPRQVSVRVCRRLHEGDMQGIKLLHFASTLSQLPISFVCLPAKNAHSSNMEDMLVMPQRSFSALATLRVKSPGRQRGSTTSYSLRLELFVST